MGTLILLYHHPDASHIVQELNARNRCWTAGDQKGYRSRGNSLNIQEDTKLPYGVREISFESKKYPGFYPTSWKIDKLGQFMELHRLTALNIIFGYDSWEPEDWYRIPDWTESLSLMQRVLDSAMTGPISKDYNFRQHLQAFDEMIEWVIDRDDWPAYYLGWSY